MRDDLRNRFGILNQTIQSYQTQQKALEVRLHRTRDIVADLTQVIQVLQFMSEHLSEEAERQTAELASMALQETFPNQNLTLKTQHTNMRGQPAVEFMMVDHDKQVEDDPMEGFGGGPKDMLGIVMRIITTIRRNNLRRVLILDEPTSQVSDDYSAPASRFIRKLCDPSSKNGLDFDMLIVTHSKVLADYAHKRYHVSQDADGYLKLEEVNGVV